MECLFFPPYMLYFIWFYFFFFNWRIIALQCVDFCYTSTGISLLILLWCHVSFLQLSTVLWTIPLSSNPLPSQISLPGLSSTEPAQLWSSCLTTQILGCYRLKNLSQPDWPKQEILLKTYPFVSWTKNNVKPHGELVWISREERLFACHHSISIFTWLNCEADQVCLH